MSFLYLAALMVSAFCVVLVDVRFRLFLGRAPREAAIVLAVGLAFFLAWDLFGIGLGIFVRGTGPFLTGVMLAPELPLEEPLFLLFLCELTMVLVLGARRMLSAQARGARRVADSGGEGSGE